CQKYSLSPFTF
nr:immunoglobulin light chain junction region [Macaca mulatta]MOV37249.1 immunoglobulin light chain junction region [Macaca mulatta]MOV37295.1 immunoglobulin light chain junction region [Macaca mulatta]MOV37351.1 immunoglobulin light chain junction region [Macaca mulatta]MOV37439.1 immunoglobulin light chain junction region [Macaca mulatta]